jgi:hypothetical protein
MPSRKHVPISPASLPRFIAWAWLWLLKHAWFLVYGGPQARKHLLGMRRAIANIIVIRAQHRFAKPLTKRRPRRPSAASNGFAQRTVLGRRALRAVIGSRLRRALRARSCGAWLSALLNALADIEAWTEHVLARFQRRLTRLYAIVPVRPPARAFMSHAPALTPAFADSS